VVWQAPSLHAAHCLNDSNMASSVMILLLCCSVAAMSSCRSVGVSTSSFDDYMALLIVATVRIPSALSMQFVRQK
jgi:hypothetical protein